MVKILKTSLFLFFNLLAAIYPVSTAGAGNREGLVPRGISVGVNLAGLGNRAIDNDHSGLSFVSRVTIRENLFLTGEAGFETIGSGNQFYDYSSSGSFLRVGPEFDMLENGRTGNDNLLVGIMYGIAVQAHESPGFTVANPYWGGYQGAVASNSFTSHWLEISSGPRAEIFSRFFMSWKLHLRVLAVSTNSGIMKPYNIPGFGNGSRRVNIGFSYTLEYMLPWSR